MLEIKNLKKTYKPKRGVPVIAINDISLKFPDNGMIFLLGKSGSGKSTLLNLLGGLDAYDSGEIIIKGESSKNFKQKHFDSYRNTYVGFIFQEYNILDEFSVGANIALALELQGEKATDEKINQILKEVDLEGYGQRKPNELSGGQKQRVAIARALVKNPKIIMADEPTGALDSNTGKQIFDTLKKLSKDKLIIVVSHDRDFAEKYADRIIELSDGNVISDLVYLNSDNEDVADVENCKILYSGNSVTVSEGYHLTEEDRIAINDYIDKIKNGNLTLVVNDDTNKKSDKKVIPTDNEKIINNDKEPFKLIKSKLPIKNAFKLGVSGLKYKKIRLVFTILLSCVAFSLFGLSDTLSAYKHFDACANSIKDSKVTYTAFKKAKKISWSTDSDFYYYDSYSFLLSDNDIEKIENDTGIKLSGVYVPTDIELDFSSQLKEENIDSAENILYRKALDGFVEITKDYIDKVGYELISGNFPDGNKNEIVISKYICETFIKSKFVSSYDEMVGKNIAMGGNDYKVVGILDTHFDLERYKPLAENNLNPNLIDEIYDYALRNELNYRQIYSLSCVAFVGENYISNMIKESSNIKPITNGAFRINQVGTSEIYNSVDRVGILNDLSKEDIVWIDGEKKELGDGEIIIASDILMGMGNIEDSLKSNNSFIAQFENNIGEYKSSQIEGKIVGIIDSFSNSEMSRIMLCGDSLYKKLVDSDGGIYLYAAGAMPENINEIKKLVEYGDTTAATETMVYKLENEVVDQMSGLNSGLKTISDIFFWVGLGFAVFAALMLSNFISISIAHKKQEIGILRAIGSRSNDVFRIFFSESFVIAIINFILSVIGTAVATSLINYFIRKSTFLLITVLSFSIRQIILLFVVSLLVAFLASYIPVWKIASKKPIDAIRNR